ncbi:MAG: dimethyladenosine transferase [Bacteroidetes bacterium]|nr:dimethyladenosine transferase [Bacteroidota bacterium]
MNKILFSIYRVLVPKPLRTIILKKTLRKKILKHFASLTENEVNDEQREVLRYLDNNPVKIFPYPFYDNYSPEKIEVLFDPQTGMRYVMHERKRLYFKKRWGEKRIKKAYSDLLREQDLNSPHRYLTESFTIGNDDVIADIGSAEGNFSLSVIEKIKKVYLFEYNKEWIEALKATFAPWAEKVEIINKYVSDYDNGSHIKFDSFYKTKRDITLLKIDVDGNEAIVLNSCCEVFDSPVPFKVALCTYHKNYDEKDFTLLLRNHGFSVTPSKGYMIFYFDKKMKVPWLRRGLIRATR